MIVNFASRCAEDLYHGSSTKHSRSIPAAIWSITQRKLDMINAAHQLLDLRIPPGNRLEKLVVTRSGFHSIRVNDQYRIIFRWSNGHAHDVDIVDYH